MGPQREGLAEGRRGGLAHMSMFDKFLRSDTVWTCDQSLNMRLKTLQDGVGGKSLDAGTIRKVLRSDIGDQSGLKCGGISSDGQ